MTRRLFLVLILYFAADFAIPFEPGPGRFVIEDMEEAVAAPGSSARVRAAHEASTPPPARPALRGRPSAPRPTPELARREWRTPLPLRVAASADPPASPDDH